MKYVFSIAFVVLRFAIENYFPNGWHPFGIVGIGVDLSGTHELDPETFVDPVKQPRVPYGL